MKKEINNSSSKARNSEKRNTLPRDDDFWVNSRPTALFGNRKCKHTKSGHIQRISPEMQLNNYPGNKNIRC